MVTEPMKDKIADFVSGFSIETTPLGAKKTHDFREHLDKGTWVYVTSLPGSDFIDTVDACKKLSNEGMVPVPHFTARSIANRKTFEENLSMVVGEAGVERVLAIAGADRNPAGDYKDTMTLLETGLFDKFGIRSIGLAGHPEGSPDITSDQLKEHGLRKSRYSQTTAANLYLVTQFVFEAKPVIDWVEKINGYGNEMPVVVGLPGLATTKSLIKHAYNCGIGPSMGILKKQPKNITKLLTLQEPDKLVFDLTKYIYNKPDSRIDGVHVFPFGGLSSSAAWSNAVANSEIECHSTGFKVNAKRS